MSWSKEVRDWFENLTTPDADGGRIFKVTNASQFTADQPAGADSYSTFRSLTTSNTGEVIKASAGNVYGWNITNLTAGTIFVKLYNKATAPTGAGDTPVRVIMVPASQSVLVTPNSGILKSFAAGISIRTTTGAADTDVASPATSPIVEVFYK